MQSKTYGEPTIIQKMQRKFIKKTWFMYSTLIKPAEWDEAKASFHV